jgi:hypothetical protein
MNRALNRIRRRYPHFVPSTLVAAAGYAVLVLFGLAYAILSWGWPRLSGRATTAIAALISAPVLFAFIWNRLSGIKVGGVEVSLAQASTPLEAPLEEVVMQQYYSDDPGVIELITKSLVHGMDRVVEVNLHQPESPYWWSTRLYLVAALAHDYSNIQAFIFVDGDEQRFYVGSARPASLRSALAQAFPSLPAGYAFARGGIGVELPETEQVTSIVKQWTVASFDKDGKPVQELEYMVRVNRALLWQWMTEAAETLDGGFVEWRGYQDRALLSAIVGFPSSFVPLVMEGSLHKVVSRQAVADQIATKALQ